MQQGRQMAIPLEPLHPPMHDDKAVSLAILMSNALGGPTADGIDDVGRAFDGTEAIAQTVPEGVDHTSIRYPWLQPLFVYRNCHCYRQPRCKGNDRSQLLPKNTVTHVT